VTRAAWTTAALVLTLQISIAAQSRDASLSGTVKDQTGAPLPGATITATDVARGTFRSDVTDTTGRYHLLNLVPSTYDVATELSGFTPAARRAPCRSMSARP